MSHHAAACMDSVRSTRLSTFILVQGEEGIISISDTRYTHVSGVAATGSIDIVSSSTVETEMEQ